MLKMFIGIGAFLLLITLWHIDCVRGTIAGIAFLLLIPPFPWI